jgi:hypothetical protein
MHSRRRNIADRKWSLPVAAAIVGCVVGVSLSGRAVAQQPEIQFGTLDPTIGIPNAAATGARHSAGSAGAEKNEAPAPGTSGSSRLTPHIGFDVGGSGASLDALSHPSPNGLQSNYDPDRRYRARAGIDYDVNSKIQLGLGYRYSNFEHPDLVLAPAPDSEMESQQREQAATFSLRYKFGGS